MSFPFSLTILAMCLLSGCPPFVVGQDGVEKLAEETAWRKQFDEVRNEVSRNLHVLSEYDLPPGFIQSVGRARFRALDSERLATALSNIDNPERKRRATQLLIYGDDLTQLRTCAQYSLEQIQNGDPNRSQDLIQRELKRAIEDLLKVTKRQQNDLDRLGPFPKLNPNNRKSLERETAWLDAYSKVISKHQESYNKSSSVLKHSLELAHAHEVVRTLFYSEDREGTLFALEHAQRIEGGRTCLIESGSLARPFGAWNHARRVEARAQDLIVEWKRKIVDGAPTRVVETWNRLEGLIGSTITTDSDWPRELTLELMARPLTQPLVLVFWEGGDPLGALERIATKFPPDQIIGITERIGVFADSKGRVWGIPEDKAPPAEKEPELAAYWRDRMGSAQLILASNGATRPRKIQLKRMVRKHLNATACLTNLVVVLSANGKVLHLQDLASPLDWLDPFLH